MKLNKWGLWKISRKKLEKTEPIDTVASSVDFVKKVIWKNRFFCFFCLNRFFKKNRFLSSKKIDFCPVKKRLKSDFKSIKKNRFFPFFCLNRFDFKNYFTWRIMNTIRIHYCRYQWITQRNNQSLFYYFPVPVGQLFKMDTKNRSHKFRRFTAI